jgi:hypothetical protein
VRGEKVGEKGLAARLFSWLADLKGCQGWHFRVSVLVQWCAILEGQHLKEEGFTMEHPSPIHDVTMGGESDSILAAVAVNPRFPAVRANAGGLLALECLNEYCHIMRLGEGVANSIHIRS